MAQNMNVSVTLKFVDQFTSGVRQLQQQMQGLTQGVLAFNRAAGTSSNTPFGRMQQQVRTLRNDVQQLVGSFQQLNRATGTSSGGGLVQGQVAGMRQLLQLQTQAIANNNRLASGGGRGPTPPGGPTSWGGGIWGRRGFSPNASLADRLQYRGVNVAEQALATGALGLDRARTQLGMLGLSEEDQREAEIFAREYSQTFRALNRAHILESVREIIPQFKTTAEAFQFTPELLRIQDWLVLNGATVDQARSGMLKLTRAVGLSSRLTGPEGNLTLAELQKFLEAYLRGAIIGGADVTPDQAFQLVKYMKSIGQTIDVDEMLRMFIAMPDLGASTFGNQSQMFVRQLTGRATKEAMAAQERAGLIRGRIQENTAGGPRKFVHESTVDEELLNMRPMEWVAKHIIGPGGFLQRSGIDPMSSAPGTPARIRAALRPLFSNSSADNWINLIVNQIQEIRNQYETATRLDTSEAAASAPGRRKPVVPAQCSQVGLAGRARISHRKFQGTPADPRNCAREAWSDRRLLGPQDRQSSGRHGAPGRRCDRRVPDVPPRNRGHGDADQNAPRRRPWLHARRSRGRHHRSGMILRSMGGGAAAGLAAGAAGVAAGASFARRFVSAAGSLLALAIPKLLLWVQSSRAYCRSSSSWETVKTRLLAIWEELKQAAPTWLGGGGRAGVRSA